MRLAVDAGQCQGHGRCYDLAPALLEADDEGYVTIRGGSVEVPPDQLQAAADAVGSCPEGALSLSDE